MTIVQIRSGIPYDSNIFLIKGKSAILIDTGTGLDSVNVISNIWKELDGIRLSAILLTHCHIDHIGGASDIAEEFGCPVYISECEVPVLANGDDNISVASGFGISLKKVLCKKILPTDVFDIGDHRLTIIETPGHTAGGLCFYDTVTKSLFAGDTVFARGFGRYDLPTGNLEQLSQSLKILRNVNIGTLYPGHGPSTPNGNHSVETAIAMMEDYN